MKTSDFDYYLPESKIAQSFLKDRSSSKLLILDKITGYMEHKHFTDIIDYLNPGDVLVLNNSKVMPSRIYGTKSTGAVIEVLLLKEVSKDVYECLTKKQKRLSKGVKLTFSDELTGVVLEIKEEGVTIIEFVCTGVFLEILEKIGSMPLPPYIKEKLKDNSRYNTVYSSKLGSAAAPTAGLHFTDELLESIKNKGVKVLYVTLHVGLGTFRPVTSEEVENHNMHYEEYEIISEAEEELNKALNEKRRIICVGTTSVRTLESNISKYGEFKSTKESTNIFIYPGYKFKAVDSLITNFHLPKSTLLMLVSALSSKEIIMDAYTEAINNDYRFFSFGDAMFITDIKENFTKTIKKVNKLPKEKYSYFNIIKGSSNVLISAPHAYNHSRKGKTKAKERNTSNTVKILAYYTNAHIIYTKKPAHEDPNYDESSEYKNAAKEYIINNNIKYFIDIHGLKKEKLTL